LAAFEKRITADYGIEETIESDEVREMIAHAQDFLAAARKHLI